MPVVAAVAVGGALIGAMAGGKKETSSRSNSGLEMAPETEQEIAAKDSIAKNFGELNKMTAAGPGQEDVTSAYGASKGLADMLQQYSQNAGIPSAGDTRLANEYAKQQFAPQQTLLSQSFKKQELAANNLAAQLGRSVDDPIIQARLRTEMANQSTVLGQQQQAFAGQFAQNIGQQRLGYMAQFADVKGQLASQAMANRQALVQMGSQLQNQDRSFRIQTANRWGNQTNTSGGSTADIAGGALAGAGTAMSAMGGFSSMMGGASRISSAAPSMGGGAPMALGAPMAAGTGDWGSMTMGNYGSPGGFSSAMMGRQSQVTAPSFQSSTPYYLGGGMGNPNTQNGYGWGR